MSIHCLLGCLLGGFMYTASNAFANITLIADPKVTHITIHENYEPLVDLRKTKDIIYGPSPEIPNNTDYTFMRKTVYEKLKQANALLPKSIHFCLYESYRSLDLQKNLFDARYERVQNAHPDWSKAELFHETTKLVSPLINLDGSKNIPPHSTGAAIDVYLIDDAGKPLDMGIHPKDWMDDKDSLISLTDSQSISPTAKANRKIMSEVLEKVGFVNYPTEYWHWSYGDKYWAFMTNQPSALYDSVVN